MSGGDFVRSPVVAGVTFLPQYSLLMLFSAVRFWAWAFIVLCVIGKRACSFHGSTIKTYRHACVCVCVCAKRYLRLFLFLPRLRDAKGKGTSLRVTPFTLSFLGCY